MLSTTFLCAVFLAFAANVRAMYDSRDSKVTMLNGATFNEVVHKNERPFLVEFFAPYCGYCKQMAPAYEKVAENLEGLVDVAAIDCTQSFNQPICSRYEVQGYPTVKLFVFNGKGNHKRAIDYSGSRTAADMTNFIKNNSHSFIFKVSSKNLDKSSKWNVDLPTFFSKGDSLPKAILFRSDSKPPSTLLFRALSIKFHYKIVVGEVSLADDPSVAGALGLESITPGTLVFFPSGKQSQAVRYSGPIKRNELFAFVENQLKIAQQGGSVVRYIQAQSNKDIDQACFGGNADLCVLVIASGDESVTNVESVLRNIKEKSSWAQFFTIIRISTEKGGSRIVSALNTSDDLPLVIALNAKKMKYALMMQDFSESALQSFIENALDAKVRFFSFKDKELFVSENRSEKDEL